jgi:hypothetical protein
MDFDGFYDTVKQAWESAPFNHDSGKMINSKFKRTRYSLKNGVKEYQISRKLSIIVNSLLPSLMALRNKETY